MLFKSRRFYVWFISFAVAIGFYLLYSRISHTPSIKIDTPVESIGTDVDFDSEIGMVGDVGVGTVRKAKYIHLDENKEVDREFGFEKLLHIAGDEWELEKPFINIFRSNFKCYVTSDRGKVQVETSVTGRPSPKDSTLTGNVVIHIVPEGSGGVRESFIYLDDIIFISDRSHFSTDGPVRFVSKDSRMQGRGLRLVYNNVQGRLEFLRIIHLESLSLKQSSKPPSSPQTPVNTAAVTTSEVTTQQLPEPVGVTAAVGQEPTASESQEQQGQYYRCVLSKNVLINTSEQLIFAYDKVFVNNALFSSGSDDKSDTTAEDNTKPSEEITPQRAAAEQSQTRAAVADNVQGSSVTAVKPGESGKSPQQFEDIVITCDNGILVVPMGPLDTSRHYAGLESEASAIDDNVPENLDDSDGRSIFIARKIDYDAITEDIISTGSSELTFYTKDETPGLSGETAVPVKITAQKQTRFLAASNQAIFEGDCLCKMPQKGISSEQNYTLLSPKLTVNLPEDRSKQQSALLDVYAAGPAELTFYTNNLFSDQGNDEALPVKVVAQKQIEFSAQSNRVTFEGNSLCTMLRQYPGFQQKYTLSAPRLTVDLTKDRNGQTSGPAGGIEHLTADGGVVRLATVKTAEEKLLGGVELKCSKFDYDTPKQVLLATGPGTIAVDNSMAPAVEQTTDNKFSLQKPCYAVVRDFQTLEYLLDANQIIADAGQQALLIDYFPIVESGQYGQQTAFTARHMVIDLVETGGQSELSSLTATGGITYDDDDKQFIGERLFYDADESVITVRGDRLQPCLLNGAKVDAIEYDLKTEKVNAKVVAPGVLRQMKR